MTFTKEGKLIVSVVMAKDIVREEDPGCLGPSKAALLGCCVQSASYSVKIQLVPFEWFPSEPVFKTRTVKSDPAVYEETFE